jgi:hypothetical protein
MFVERARRALREVNPVVIGITGSYGKTSTKTYLAHILNGRYHAYPTPKSYNTLMGVCIAINNDVAGNHSIEYFIAEMVFVVAGAKVATPRGHPPTGETRGGPARTGQRFGGHHRGRRLAVRSRDGHQRATADRLA